MVDFLMLVIVGVPRILFMSMCFMPLHSLDYMECSLVKGLQCLSEHQWPLTINVSSLKINGFSLSTEALSDWIYHT